MSASSRWLVAWLSLASSASSAAEVFVNGVNVEGLSNQTFEKVTVRLDEAGNVYIEAPGYNVKKVTLTDERPAPRATAALTKKYFLVTEQKPWGGTDTEADLFLNGTLFKTIKSTDEQLVLDITDQLSPGVNRVVVKARRRVPAGAIAKPRARSHLFRVIIGEGVVDQDAVTIGKQLVTFARTGVDQNDVTEEFTFATR